MSFENPLGRGKVWGQAVLIEQQARKDRWLMVKALLGELYPAERLEALRQIEGAEHHLTQGQLKQIEDLIQNSDFITIDQKEYAI